MNFDRTFKMLKDSRPLAHPHAEKMAMYAEDARETPEPWLRWHCFHPWPVDRWIDCNTHPRWHKDLGYRRKPKAKEHTVNGFEVPAPETEPLSIGDIYYAPHPLAWEYFEKCWWKDDEHDRRNLERGLVFITEVDAAINGRAMLGISPHQEQEK